MRSQQKGKAMYTLNSVYKILKNRKGATIPAYALGALFLAYKDKKWYKQEKGKKIIKRSEKNKK